jgi:hypothetical protein
VQRICALEHQLAESNAGHNNANHSRYMLNRFSNEDGINSNNTSSSFSNKNSQGECAKTAVGLQTDSRIAGTRGTGTNISITEEPVPKKTKK